MATRVSRGVPEMRISRFTEVSGRTRALWRPPHTLKGRRPPPQVPAHPVREPRHQLTATGGTGRIRRDSVERARCLANAGGGSELSCLSGAMRNEGRANLADDPEQSTCSTAGESYSTAPRRKPGAVDRWLHG